MYGRLNFFIFDEDGLASSHSLNTLMVMGVVIPSLKGVIREWESALFRMVHAEELKKNHH